MTDTRPGNKCPLTFPAAEVFNLSVSKFRNAREIHNLTGDLQIGFRFHAQQTQVRGAPHKTVSATVKGKSTGAV